MDERGNRVEGIEQKMRVDLHPQRLQFGLRQAGLQGDGVALPNLGFVKMGERHAGAHGKEIHQDVRRHMHACFCIPRWNFFRPRQVRRRWRHGDEGPVSHLTEDDDQKTGEQMQDGLRTKVWPFQRKPERKPDNQWEEQQPQGPE